MKATEIVEKLKSVLLNSEIEEVEVNEPVELAEDEEVAVESPKEEMGYVTKDEFESKLAELKAMYDNLMEKMADETEEEKDVPEELAEEPQEEVEEVKEELSAQEPPVEPISHTPEEEVEKGRFKRFANQRPQSTTDIVFNKLFNK